MYYGTNDHANARPSVVPDDETAGGMDRQPLTPTRRDTA